MCKTLRENKYFWWAKYYILRYRQVANFIRFPSFFFSLVILFTTPLLSFTLMSISPNNLLTTENNKFMLATFIWHLLRQPKWVSETPSRVTWSLSLRDDPWLHWVCLSVFLHSYLWVCVYVCVPTRIMMLVGASCLGPRLSINPTDGASLGSELCIWWPGGKLANGVHHHANTHTRTHAGTQPIRVEKSNSTLDSP